MSRGWEAVVPWLFVGVGTIIALALGRYSSWPKGKMSPQHWGARYCVTAFLVVLLLGVALVVPTIASITYCIETLRACVSHGDGNMSYWFHAFLAIPLYWIVMVMTAAHSRRDKSDAA